MGIYLNDVSTADCEIDDEYFRQSAIERAAPMRFKADAALQRIVRRAADAYGTASSAVTIINWRKQVILAGAGCSLDTTPREESICDVTIQRPGEPLIVHDARMDARLNRKSVVLRAPFVRFYAGCAIVDGAGYPLGALCVFDPEAREGEIDLGTLASLAREVERIVCH